MRLVVVRTGADTLSDPVGGGTAIGGFVQVTLAGLSAEITPFEICRAVSHQRVMRFKGMFETVVSSDGICTFVTTIAWLVPIA
jgi:hypothetical protein